MENQKNSLTIENLKDAFEARKGYFSNRASCVFPVYIRKNADLYIVFLNYWLLKNEIPSDKLSLNFRIYDKSGVLVKRETREGSSFANHNQFSMRNILSSGLKQEVDHFDGMVEFEIISTENIRFPFPGVVGIYQAGRLFSAVHAAGRVKNPDEAQRILYTQESNWTCKFGEDVTPFFHYFNGPTAPQKAAITVVLRAPNGTPISSKEVSIAHLPPFGSELFLVTDIFDKADCGEGCFVSVAVEHNSIFPRLVVGNYFRNLNFLEVTHSFPIVEKKDYCPVDDKVDFQSMLCAYTDPDLDLDVHVFPTNCEGAFSARVLHQRHDQPRLVDKNITVNYSTALLSEPINYKLDAAERFLCLQLKGATVPSRFNGSFIYKVKNVDSKFSTDIADGADSSVYPPKYRHWGHAYIDDGFETAILVRNNSHKPEGTKSSSGILRVYADNFESSVKITVGAESSESYRVSEIANLGPSKIDGAPRFISWMIEMEEPTCETFWVAYRKSDGAAFGEHGM